MQRSESLKCEPSSEPLHISAEKSFLNRQHQAMRRDVTSTVCGESEATSTQLTGSSGRLKGSNRHPKPEIRKPKSETKNLKPETRSPKP